MIIEWNKYKHLYNVGLTFYYKVMDMEGNWTPLRQAQMYFVA